MAEIRPFRAWRYNRELGRRIDLFTCLPGASEGQPDAFYQEPYNSIHLSAPKGPAGADRAASMLQRWKDEGILIQDKLPAVYVYLQRFKRPDSSREYFRRALVCNVRIQERDEKILFNSDFSVPFDYQEGLFEKTLLHAVAIQGLYSDPTLELEAWMDDAIYNPIYETQDNRGTYHMLAVIHDAAVIRKIIQHLKDRTITLVSGYRQHASSLAYRRKMSSEKDTGEEAHYFQMMFLSNSESNDFELLPTHSVIQDMPDFTEEKVLRRLAPYFVIKPIEDLDAVAENIRGKPWSFGLLFGENTFEISLLPEAVLDFQLPTSGDLGKASHTALRQFIIEKAFGLRPSAQPKSKNLSLELSLTYCRDRVRSGEAQMVIATQNLLTQDKDTGESGDFFPGVICGLLFSSIREEEFTTPPFSPFSTK